MSARLKWLLGLLLLIAVAIGFAPTENTAPEPVMRAVRPRVNTPVTSTTPTRAAPQLQRVRSRASWPTVATESGDATPMAAAPFAAHDWSPPPPPPPPPADPTQQAPDLPYTYLGKQQQNGNWQVFLGSAQGVMIVKTGDVLEARYRVDSITPDVLTLVYLPLNLPQALALE